MEVGHRDYGKTFTVTIKDVDKNSGTCSIQYYRISKWQENQSLLNFEVVSKLGVSPIPTIPSHQVKEKAETKSIPPPHKPKPTTKSTETMALEQRRQKRKAELSKYQREEKASSDRKDRVKQLQKNWKNKKEHQPVHIDFLQSLGR